MGTWKGNKISNKQRQLNEKSEKTGTASDKHVICLCSTKISQVVKKRYYYSKIQKMIPSKKIKRLT